MAEPAEKNFLVSWDQLHRDTRALAWRLADHGPWQRVVAIARGGLVPAAIVARELAIRVVDTVCVTTYGTSGDDKKRGELKIVKPPSIEGDGEGWLIVDDLVDTGVTARAVRALLPKAHFATIYAKPAGRPLVDTFVTEVSQDTWIYFPWDLEQRPVDPIAALRPKR